jgi:hypothetical protein
MNQQSARNFSIVALMKPLIEERNAGIVGDCCSEFRVGSNVDPSGKLDSGGRLCLGPKILGLWPKGWTEHWLGRHCGRLHCGY